MRIRSWMAIALLSLPLLNGCGGGGGGDGDSSVRLVNTADGYDSLDLYADESELAGAVTSYTASTYRSLGSGTYSFKLKRAGSSTTAGSASRTVSGGNSYTVIAYSTADALRFQLLSEAETAPSAGAAKLRVFNGSVEAGALDVYVTDPAVSLDSSSPTAASIGAERLNTYTEISAGTYRVRVTGAGDKSDLRLDLPAVTLTDQQITTLVLTSSTSGVLVHAATVDQKGAVAAQRNTAARVRLVAGANANASVAATVRGVVLSGGLPSSSVGNYALVTAGALTGTATIAGQAVTLPATTLAAGSDNTLLVTGSAGAGTATLLADDNRPPLNTANTKVRLVNGVGSLASPLTLTADFSAVANDIAVNTASAPVAVPVTTGTGIRLEVTSLGASLFLAEDVALLAGRVYTVFMLGDAGSPVGVPRRDR